MAQMVYVDGLATPGNFTTSGSANTEVDAIDFIASATGGSVNVCCRSSVAGGKSQGLTTLTAIGLRVRKYATGSTVRHRVIYRASRSIPAATIHPIRVRLLAPRRPT